MHQSGAAPHRRRAGRRRARHGPCPPAPLASLNITRALCLLALPPAPPAPPGPLRSEVLRFVGGGTALAHPRRVCSGAEGRVGVLASDGGDRPDGRRARFVDGDRLTPEGKRRATAVYCIGHGSGRSSRPRRARPARQASACRCIFASSAVSRRVLLLDGCTPAPRAASVVLGGNKWAFSRRTACSPVRRRWPHPGRQAPRHRLLLQPAPIVGGLVGLAERSRPAGHRPLGSSSLRWRCHGASRGVRSDAQGRRCAPATPSTVNFLDWSTATGSPSAASAAPPRSPATGRLRPALSAWSSTVGPPGTGQLGARARSARRGLLYRARAPIVLGLVGLVQRRARHGLFGVLALPVLLLGCSGWRPCPYTSRLCLHYPASPQTIIAINRAPSPHIPRGNGRVAHSRNRATYLLHMQLPSSGARPRVNQNRIDPSPTVVLLL